MAFFTEKNIISLLSDSRLENEFINGKLIRDHSNNTWHFKGEGELAQVSSNITWGGGRGLGVRRCWQNVMWLFCCVLFTLYLIWLVVEDQSSIWEEMYAPKCFNTTYTSVFWYKLRFLPAIFWRKIMSRYKRGEKGEKKCHQM